MRTDSPGLARDGNAVTSRMLSTPARGSACGTPGSSISLTSARSPSRFPPRSSLLRLSAHVTHFLAELDAEERQLAAAREQDRDLALRLLTNLAGRRIADIGIH